MPWPHAKRPRVVAVVPPPALVEALVLGVARWVPLHDAQDVLWSDSARLLARPEEVSERLRPAVHAVRVIGLGLGLGLGLGFRVPVTVR